MIETIFGFWSCLSIWHTQILFDLFLTLTWDSATRRVEISACTCVRSKSNPHWNPTNPEIYKSKFLNQIFCLMGWLGWLEQSCWRSLFLFSLIIVRVIFVVLPSLLRCLNVQNKYEEETSKFLGEAWLSSFMAC